MYRTFYSSNGSGDTYTRKTHISKTGRCVFLLLTVSATYFSHLVVVVVYGGSDTCTFRYQSFSFRHPKRDNSNEIRMISEEICSQKRRLEMNIQK